MGYGGVYVDDDRELVVLSLRIVEVCCVNIGYSWETMPFVTTLLIVGLSVVC